MSLLAQTVIDAERDCQAAEDERDRALGALRDMKAQLETTTANLAAALGTNATLAGHLGALSERLDKIRPDPKERGEIKAAIEAAQKAIIASVSKQVEYAGINVLRDGNSVIRKFEFVRK